MERPEKILLVEESLRRFEPRPDGSVYHGEWGPIPKAAADQLGWREAATCTPGFFLEELVPIIPDVEDVDDAPIGLSARVDELEAEISELRSRVAELASSIEAPLGRAPTRRTNLPADALSGFELVDEVAVRLFLEKNDLLPLLQTGRTKAKAIFGPNAKFGLSLRGEDDHRRLVFSIITEKSAVVAAKCLEALGDAWGIEALVKADGRLSTVLEFA